VILARLGESNRAITELEYTRSLALNQPLSTSLLPEIDKSLQKLRSITGDN